MSSCAKIILFGDSNTWGFSPRTGLQQENRFARLLQQEHPEWIVVADGQNGRLMSSSDPYFRAISGAAALPAVLKQQSPFSLLVLLLGSNDARRLFHQNSAGWMQAFDVLLDTAIRAIQDVWKSCGQPGLRPPALLVVQPPGVFPALKNSIQIHASLGESGVSILSQTAREMERKTVAAGGWFLKTEGLLYGGALDGIHLDTEGHRRMARLLEEAIEVILNNESAPEKNKAETTTKEGKRL